MIEKRLQEVFNDVTETLGKRHPESLSGVNKEEETIATVAALGGYVIALQRTLEPSARRHGEQLAKIVAEQLRPEKLSGAGLVGLDGKPLVLN